MDIILDIEVREPEMLYKKNADGSIVDEQGNAVTNLVLNLDGTYSDSEGNVVEVQADAQPAEPNLQEQLIEANRQVALYKEKANGYDALFGDEEFIQWAYNRKQREMGNATQQTPAQQQPAVQQENPFSEYQDADGLMALSNTITKNVLAAIEPRFKDMDDRMGQNFEPLLQNLSQSRVESDFNALVHQSVVNKQHYPVDPATIRKQIDYERQKNPNLNMQQAYDLSCAQMNRQGLVTRPPIQQEGSGSPQGGTGANILTKPAGGQTNIKTGAGQTTLDKALEAKSKGGDENNRRQIEDIIAEAAQQMEADGNPIDMNELS